ncbi:MAG: undecaprenyl-diphosphatase UppP [Bacilli bacterium]
MIDIIETIILGIVQGIGEFLPISSSAHLIIFRDVFNIGSFITANKELSFDIALHFGTLMAIGLYFFKDFINMIIKGFTKGVKDDEGKIFWYLIVATIPAAIAGLLFEDVIDKVIRGNLVVIALALMFIGILIYYVDKLAKTTKSIKTMNLKDAIFIGCSQVFALIPGFSRSGTTIMASRIRGLDKESSAKFSFFLSAPVVCGAVVLQLLDKNTISIIIGNLNLFVIGIISSFISGLLCISFLLKYLKNHDFKIFMWYRIILAIIILGTLVF